MTLEQSVVRFRHHTQDSCWKGSGAKTMFNCTT